LIAPALAFRARAVNQRVRAAAAEALGELAVAEAAGPVAGALFDLSPAVRRAAWAALPGALEALTDGWYGKVEARHVNILCRALGRGSATTDVAILEALGHVGGASAVGPVERMARSGRSPAIRACAERALPVLRERRRAETDPVRLLRPVGAPSDPENVLLRPACGAPSPDDTAKLVRPADE
jgi:HEAT repeat protein